MMRRVAGHGAEPELMSGKKRWRTTEVNNKGGGGEVKKFGAKVFTVDAVHLSRCVGMVSMAASSLSLAWLICSYCDRRNDRNVSIPSKPADRSALRSGPGVLLPVQVPGQSATAQLW